MAVSLRLVYSNVGVNPEGLTNMLCGTVCPVHGDALATTCCFDEDQSQPVRAPGLMNGPGTGVWELGALDEKNQGDPFGGPVAMRLWG